MKNNMPIIGYGAYKVSCEDVANALRAGYRRIDTAHAYSNEEEVGLAVRDSGIPRGEVFVTSKVTTGALREDKIHEEFDKTMSLLGMDYVDLYIIHWPVPGKFVSAWAQLEKIHDSGRARAIGVSNYQIHHLDEVKKISRITPAINQVELHPYLTQKPLREYCAREGIAVEAWSPLAAAKTGLLDEPIITEIAAKHGIQPSQVVLRWDVQQGIYTIPKSSNPQRMAVNLDVFGFSLTDEEIAAIDSLNKDHRTGPDPDNFDF